MLPAGIESKNSLKRLTQTFTRLERLPRIEYFLMKLMQVGSEDTPSSEGAGKRTAALRVRDYLVPIIGLVLITVPSYILQQSPPPHNAVIGGVLVTGILVLILGSAWLGYGTGLLNCVLLCFVVPQMIPHSNRALPILFGQFLVLSFVSYS